MKIIFSEDAIKQLGHLPKPAQTKIYKKINSLQSNPFSGKKLSGELKDYWTIRAWPYRIIYEINQKEKRIDVHKISHRQGAYK